MEDIYNEELLDRIFRTYKRCCICEKVKLLDDGYTKKNISECKVCRKEINKNHYLKKKNKRILENQEKNTLEILEK